MLLEIITPKTTIYKGEVSLVRVPGSNGSFAMMKNHAPIISSLETGLVHVVETNKNIVEFELVRTGGTVEFKKNRIIILSESVRKI
jgi:F-type H+-transporting ATPase subunit epsilon